MKLVNSTASPAILHRTGADDAPQRTGILTAKTTFCFDETGGVEVDRSSPYPLFKEDEVTELGILPADTWPKVDPTLEVILLGWAHAPGGSSVQEMTVSLSVGQMRRELTVIGDREWIGAGSGARPSTPESFRSMPLTYTRAYGGRVEVLVDEESPVPLSCPFNGDGKGFDHITQAAALAKALDCPKGFPVFEPTRLMPNLENPNHRITRWDDAPLPACWATTPMQSAMLVERARRADLHNPGRPLLQVQPESLHRAHPDWVINPPPPRARVTLEGLNPSGRISFQLPDLRMVADLRAGDRIKTLPLEPRLLVLLPEESRFYIVHRNWFIYTYRENDQRVARLREESAQGQPEQYR